MTKNAPRCTAELRRVNRNRVFRCLYSAAGPMTKQDLAYALSMSLPTLTQNLGELLELGLIDNSETADSTGGRKPRILSVVSNARWALGVEISSGHIRLVALDLQVRELGFRAVRRAFRPEEDYGEDLARVIEEFIDGTGLDRSRLLGVGITVPGIVDSAQTYIADAPTLGVRRMEAERLICHIPYPTYLVNDANAGGFAEQWGRPGGEHMAYLSLGRGVGGAILVSGAAYTGQNARAGEFGHMCIHPGGEMCSCGRRGCLEAYCSTARLSDDLGLTLEEFFDHLDRDGAEQALWDAYLDDLAVGVSNIHVALDCGVVLGGKLSRFLADRIDGLDRRLRALDPNYQQAPYLSVCRHHDRANGIGAALYFVEQFIGQI